MSRKNVLISVFALLAIGAGSGYLIARNRIAPSTPLSSFVLPQRTAAGTVPATLFDVPKFDYTNQDGQKESNSGLQGRVWVADFIFTHCAGMCPIVTGKMVDLQKRVTDPEVRFVSFSVDPEHDDPATLKSYREKYNAQDSRWLLLRPNDRKAIALLAQKMAAFSSPIDPNDSLLHTDFFELIDETGKVRGLYDSKQPTEVDRLKADIATLERIRLSAIAKQRVGSKAD